MPGNGISGIRGQAAVTSATDWIVAELTKWVFNPKATNPAYRSNKTGGFTARVIGYKDGSGSIDGKWEPTDVATAWLAEGNKADLKLTVTDSQMYLVPALFNSFQLTVDVDTAEVTGWTANFDTTDAWTAPSSMASMPTAFVHGGVGASQPAKAAHAIASGGGHQAAASADLGRVQTERQQIMHMVQMAVQEAIPGAVQQIMEEIRKAA